MKTVTVKIPDPLDAKLRAAAKNRRKGKSTMIRELLEKHFRVGRARRSVTSCLDLSRDLSGLCEGPADLSHNKAYMKGFGQ